MNASIDLTLAHVDLGGERKRERESVCVYVYVRWSGDEEGCYCSYTMLLLMGSR